jgi:hypothetical protein
MFVNTRGDILDDKKLLRIDLALPHILIVDTGHMAGAYLHFQALAAQALEGYIPDIYILDAGGTLYLDDIPLTGPDRIQYIRPAENIAGQNARFEKGPSGKHIFPGNPDIGGKITGGNINAHGKKLFSQCSHLMPLVEGKLCDSIGRRDAFRFVHRGPQVLVTLQPTQKIGLG